MSEIHGPCNPAFNRIRDLLQERKTSGKEIVTALAALILVDRGLLDVEERVSTYWPEFGVNGKEDTRVWHLLSHSSGVPQWEKPVTLDFVYDTKAATEMLAGQAPWYKAGEVSAYQLVAHGHLIGELVRRVSGKSLTEFIADEIAAPLGADFTLGLPEEDWPRAADVIDPPPIRLPGDLDPESVAVRTYSNLGTKPQDSQTPGFRRTEVGGLNGFSNARGLARIGSIMSLNGTVDGKRYLGAKTVEQVLQERVSGFDLVLLMNLRFGLGLGLPVPDSIPFVPEGRICFWGGWGGSFVVMDLDRRMTIACTMNKMGAGILGSDNAKAYIDAIYEIVSDKGVSASL
ncbi:hypothetical protein N7457_004103 [Penicillium paradoxum]|uniref:uncharacterized protein n=1 Tax=Penicillium paradoxum TaxID=176176 RepID=UPI002547739F|nr:uncharacterized protein N7457_004103 [Penicillium paradoxum]KAJ5782329.1 hypothetical protein N7457_004103 [Penicillium paradoxum]